MTILRLYHPHALAIATSICLIDEAHHRVSQVLRKKVGDRLILFNGEGGCYLGLIEAIDKKKTTILLESFSSDETESPLSICLAHTIVRQDKMDFIIQKAVELGVMSILPLFSEYGNVHVDPQREMKKIAHWQKIIASACEQSGRNRLPQLRTPIALTKWLTCYIKQDMNIILSPTGHHPFPGPTLDNIRSFNLLIGPEGGFSPKEVEMAEEAGFIPMKLGPRILRTETAPLVAMSILQYHYGDLGKL